MKVSLVLMVCAVVAAAAEVKVARWSQESDALLKSNPAVDALVWQLFGYLRAIINNGSNVLGTPPLDPLELDDFHLEVPAGILNLNLQLKNIRMVGLNGFQVQRTNLNLDDMTFDVDILLPRLDVSAENYDLDGDFLTAFPLYGNGEARFLVTNFRFQARAFLKQSEDRRSVLIDRVENVSFALPGLKSDLTGAIGGGDIDAIVNAMIDDVIVDYINRFQGAIAAIASPIVISYLNPYLDKLDTWRHIQPHLPRA